jgi:phosphopantothenoylcysteine decarboxylase / phosphopantothenate---cysteine ligase
VVARADVAQRVVHARELGYQILEPDTGPLAVGEGSGPGRMPEPETIFAHVGRLLDEPSLRGRRVVVTAGPTREAVDPVRFLSNRSSGKMGVALATRAWQRGADVTLISGPLGVPLPAGVTIASVESTSEMAEAVRRELATADVLIMAAAPADFRVATPAASKIKKADAPESIPLAPTVDILRATRDARRPGAVIVGFALETDDVVENGRAKLEAKELDLVVINDATEKGAGFGVDTNRVTIVRRDGSEESLELMPKADVADAILDRVEETLRGR